MHLSDLREKEIKELISMATELKIENPGELKISSAEHVLQNL